MIRRHAIVTVDQEEHRDMLGILDPIITEIARADTMKKRNHAAITLR